MSTQEGNIIVIERNGSMKWEYYIGGNNLWNPIINSSNCILAVSGGKIFSLSNELISYLPLIQNQTH